MFRELIRQSWERSAHYSVPVEHLAVPMIQAEDLQKRLDVSSYVIETVDHFIEPLQKVLKDRDYCLGFIDADGVLLKVYHCNEYLRDVYKPGTVWRERNVGTTAVAIALATEKVAVVDFDEHYNEVLKSVVAIGHPVVVYGNLLGVLSLALEIKDGLEYLVNLISALMVQVEEQLLLHESFMHQKEETQSLDRIFRTFIHEIKNPLTNIRAFLQLQQLRSKNEKSEFDHILKEVDRISEMIENFKYFSIEKDFSFSEINLTDLLNHLRGALRGMFDLKGWKLQFSLEEGCIVWGNEKKLKQVFLNLVKNAFEAIQSNGDVHIELWHDEKNCMIRITDNGEGMNQEELELIFQPFYTTKSSGYGLGLAVCREILVRHQGNIVFDSVKYQGTSVLITLPRAEWSGLNPEPVQGMGKDVTMVKN